MESKEEMWRELIAALFPDAKFSDPATDEDIVALERFFGCRLPPDLESLLKESNGVHDHVFSAERMIEENRLVRTATYQAGIYMSFDSMLCFGGDGTGSMFAYPICAKQGEEWLRITYWFHENDDRTLYAFDLEGFFRKRRSEDVGHGDKAVSGIVTFTVATHGLDTGQMAALDAEVGRLGFRTTVPCSEGGDMPLPEGTYACLLEIEDQHGQLRHFYRSVVDTMRRLGIKGKYFINMANRPVSNICGEL